jgi:hypothetical protein
MPDPKQDKPDLRVVPEDLNELTAPTAQRAEPSPVSAAVEAAASSSPSALSKLRVRQDYLETAGVKKVLGIVPMRKPNRQDFIRVHPDPAYRDLLAFLELKEDREVYVVDLEEVPELTTECYAATLFTAITRTGVVFLWPVRVPAADGKTNSWNESAAVAAAAAQRQWVRVVSNRSLQGYEAYIALNQTLEPQWPEASFAELFDIAIRDRLIDRIDHPIVKRLRGSV